MSSGLNFIIKSFFSFLPLTFMVSIALINFNSSSKSIFLKNFFSSKYFSILSEDGFSASNKSDNDFAEFKRFMTCEISLSILCPPVNSKISSFIFSKIDLTVWGSSMFSKSAFKSFNWLIIDFFLSVADSFLSITSFTASFLEELTVIFVIKDLIKSKSFSKVF